jgi:phage tail-like protein
MSRVYEFPSLALYEATEDALVDEPLAVINRVPEHSEVEVEAEGLRINFQVYNPGGTAVPTSGLVVRVNSFNAYASGSFAGSWAGEVAPVDAATLGFSIYPDELYGSAEVVTVQVTHVLGLDVTWSFTIKDETKPELVDAVAYDPYTVRLTFDEPMDEVATLDPSSYFLSREMVFAVTPAPARVERISPYAVDVKFDEPLTFGAAYSLSAVLAEDVYGNRVDEAMNTVTFAAFNPSVPRGRRFQLWDFIPKKNKREDTSRDLFKLISIMQEITNVLLYEIDRTETIIDFERAPEPFVDAMLDDLGNPFTVPLTLAEKRFLISVLVDVYQLKGTTVGLVSTARLLLGLEVEVTDNMADGWRLGVDELGETSVLGPEYLYELFTFDVTVDRAVTDIELARLLEIIGYMKPPHTHLGRVFGPGDTVYEIIDRGPYVAAS